jgi:hypothetical protein
MRTFTIDGDNNITVYPNRESVPADVVQFASKAELTAITADWPAGRLAATWNGFAGTPGFTELKPVKKFETRAVGVQRIWLAIQRLTCEERPPKRKAPAKDARAPKPARPGSKTAAILELLGRKGGATMDELMEATGWRRGMVHSYLSWTIRKRLGRPVTRTEGADGAPARYAIAQ